MQFLLYIFFGIISNLENPQIYNQLVADLLLFHLWFTHLSNQFDVRLGHCDRSKQLLKIIGEFASSPIIFARGVHSDKDSCIMVNFNGAVH